MLKRRLILSELSFAEIVIWQLDLPQTGSVYAYKYRLAYMVNGLCVLRFDNEAGKGNHQHLNDQEIAYDFVSPEQLLKTFLHKSSRWRTQDENSDIIR